MSLLSRLKIRTKLTLLLGLTALTVVAMIAVSAVQMQERMLQDRVGKLRAAVQMAAGLAQELDKRTLAGQLTHEAALAQLRDTLHAMRFDSGSGYVVFQASDGMVLAHGGL